MYHSVYHHRRHHHFITIVINNVLIRVTLNIKTLQGHVTNVATTIVGSNEQHSDLIINFPRY